MSSLPTELDFSRNPAATPERMDAAMEYIVARLRALEAIQPEYQSVIDQLKGVGLERVTEVLNPIFEDAQNIAAAVETIFEQISNDATVEQVTQDVTDAVVDEFADYRHRYLGAKAEAPLERDDGSLVAVGDMYFDTTLDSMRVLGQAGWKDVGSTVAGIMEQIDPIVATEGQATFTIPGGYDIGFLIVVVNGAVLPPADYTATNGTTVVLDVGLSAGDELAGIKFGAVTLATVYNKTQSDARYRLIDDSYTKGQVDAALAAKADASNFYTKSAADNRFANLTLSNLTNTATARSNLGVGSAGTRTDSYFARTGTGTSGGIMTAGTAAPSGGADNDIYFRYSA
jgi:hypothetical protein